MRLRNILIPALLPALLVSCSKNIIPRNLDFDVKSLNSAKQASTSFKVGDTVNFVFSGNPDQLSFFSGELGHEYRYSQRTTDPSNRDTLKFTTTVTTPITSTLQLLVSTSFPTYTQINKIDSANILATYPSGWTDISSRANWATSTTAVNAKLALDDFAAAGKPIYLAFRYTAPASVIQSKWVVTLLGLRHFAANTTYGLDSTNYVIPTGYPAYLTSPGWGSVIIKNTRFAFGATNGAPANTNYSVAAGPTNSNLTSPSSTVAATSVATEAWVISGPIDLHAVLPDVPGGLNANTLTAVKDMTTNASTSLYSPLSNWANFAYKFTRKGTYIVTFLAGTSTKDAQNSVAKSITITVQ